jgi:hypothetical protein
MRRVIGGLLLVVGLGMATITVGSHLGYFTILDSGDEPAVSLRDQAGTLAFEAGLVVAGLLLARRRRGSRNGAV